MIIDSRRKGITLTEILIAIMILGVGLVSLATLFPIGLLRLRDASRYTRTKYLTDSASADSTARALFYPLSFGQADNLNYFVNPLNPPWWYATTSVAGPNAYNPLVQDTPSYGGDIKDMAGNLLGLDVSSTMGNGLPFAYDPLWRSQTMSPTTGVAGYYMGDALEARFGSGIGFLRNNPSDNGIPSAHGLQRVTNFNRPAVEPWANAIPSIFVSNEDVVWVETNATSGFSPVLPDLNLKFSPGTPSNDWHYSWMFTGYQISGTGGSQFEGNIVIFENRPFGIEVPAVIPNPPGGPFQVYQVDGETVVEAVFGYSTNVNPPGGPGYGAGADRTVLLRWPNSQTDPVVKVGDWIADVTYERQNPVVLSRFLSYVPPPAPPPFAGLPNPNNKFEWDNLPSQRCIWYQVQKVSQPTPDLTVAGFRSMVVYVDRSLEARTVLNGNGTSSVLNAALISPYVVNVIPQQFTVRLSPTGTGN